MSWYLESGKDSDIVLSTRIRIKRNFDDMVFIPKASEKDQEEVFKRIKKVLPKLKEKLNIIQLKDLDSITIKELIEKNLITPEFANYYLIKDFNKKIIERSLNKNINNIDYRYIFINDNEDVCITINHENHFNIQAFSSGNEIQSLYDKLQQLNDEIGNNYSLAFDTQYGYLTSSIVDLGTAMKISAFVHLPALKQTGGINRVLDLVEKLGMNVKKIPYILGESVYQISTRQTLGISEEDLIKNFQAVISTIVKQERETRKYYADNSVDFRDKIYRSLGILLYAKKIDQQEGEELISNIKLGVDLGIIDTIDDSQIRKYMIYNKAANLQKALKNTFSEKELQIERAKYFQQI